MGLLPDTQTWGLCVHRECQKRFPRHRLQKKPLVSDPAMHHSTCATHVPWCMSGSPTRVGGENVPGACATRNFCVSGKRPMLDVDWLGRLSGYELIASCTPCYSVGPRKACILRWGGSPMYLHVGWSYATQAGRLQGKILFQVFFLPLSF